MEESRSPLSIWTFLKIRQRWLRWDDNNFEEAPLKRDSIKDTRLDRYSYFNSLMLGTWSRSVLYFVHPKESWECASQSDRWLRQAELMDGWTISTIDTAIAFRCEETTTMRWFLKSIIHIKPLGKYLVDGSGWIIRIGKIFYWNWVQPKN